MSDVITKLDTLLAEMENMSAAAAPVHEEEDVDNTSDDNKDRMETQLDILTENLTKALNTGEEIQESLGTCDKCKLDIFEKTVMVGEKTFHDNCFICDQCSVK